MGALILLQLGIAFAGCLCHHRLLKASPSFLFHLHGSQGCDFQRWLVAVCVSSWKEVKSVIKSELAGLVLVLACMKDTVFQLAGLFPTMH